ncbi:MAG: hypothetical protein ACRERV_05180, partial [Methylococcales bacterium]
MARRSAAPRHAVIKTIERLKIIAVKGRAWSGVRKWLLSSRGKRAIKDPGRSPGFGDESLAIPYFHMETF